MYSKIFFIVTKTFSQLPDSIPFSWYQDYILPLPWCIYYHHGPFQTTSMMSLYIKFEIHTTAQSYFLHLYKWLQHTTALFSLQLGLWHSKKFKGQNIFSLFMPPKI